MNRLFSTLIGAAALVASSLPASSAVFSPFDAIGSSEQVLSVTPGYTASWWVEDGTVGFSPGPGESPANIRDFVEQTSITGLTMTDDGCREGLGGLSGSNSKCSGNIFAIKVNDLGYLVFQYAAAIALDDFMITMNEPNSNLLSRMDVFTSAQEDVPLPAAFVLFGSGLAALGAARRRKAAAK